MAGTLRLGRGLFLYGLLVCFCNDFSSCRIDEGLAGAVCSSRSELDRFFARYLGGSARFFVFQ